MGKISYRAFFRAPRLHRRFGLGLGHERRHRQAGKEEEVYGIRKQVPE